MRKREQRKQQNSLADFGDRTPVSGHNRMTNVDIPRREREKEGEKNKLAWKIIMRRSILKRLILIN